MKKEELEQHRCDPNERWPEADARGIFLTYVCGQCRASKMAKYRPDVLTDPCYDADEDIEPEEPVANFPGWNAVNEDSPLYIRKPSGRYRVAEPEEIVEHALAKINVEPGHKVRSPDDMSDFLSLKLGPLEHEVFVAVFLDNRHRVIACEELFRGTIDGTSVYPREVAKRALQLNAAAVVFAHNHPSGEAIPSQADERITKRLKDALSLIDIRVLDHLIVASGGSCSFAKRGLI